MSRRGLVASAIGSVLLLAGCDASGQIDPGLLTSAGTIRAENIAFEPTAITLRAGTPVTITFENADDGIPHGLVDHEERRHRSRRPRSSPAPAR